MVRHSKSSGHFRNSVGQRGLLQCFPSSEWFAFQGLSLIVGYRISRDEKAYKTQHYKARIVAVRRWQ